MQNQEYDSAEKLLWSIISRYGTNWAEPINRLATLKYMRGEYEESKELCEVVLQIKPWHFGALRGIVLVCTALKDVGNARYWSEKCCPTLISSFDSSVDKRFAWVKGAIQDATLKLKMAAFEKSFATFE